MILVIAAFVAMIDRAVMPPLVPVIAADMGVPIDTIGVSLTVYAVTYAALQLAWSTLANRIGRVRVLVISTALGGLCNVGTALAVDPVMYSVTRGLAGAAFSATITTVLIYYGDTLTMAGRAVATANLAAAISLGLAAGTLGAGAIAQWFGWRWVFVTVAVVSFALTVWLARLREAPRTEPEPLRTSLARLARNRWAVAILVYTLVEGALIVGVFNYLPVAMQAHGFSVFVAGLVTAAFGATVVIVSQLIKLVLGRWPAWLLLAIAGVAIVVGYAGPAVSIEVGTVLAATILVGVAWTAGHTTMQTWMTDAATDTRAIGMSLFSISLFIGASIGAALGNLAAGANRFELLFVVTSVVAVLYTAATAVSRARYVVREDE